MTTNDAFVLALALGFALLFRWAFRVLPREQWQIMASVPRRKTPAMDGWLGVNLTYYGLLTATATTLGIGLLVVLLGAIGVTFAASIVVITGLLGVCLPAAKIVARWVERKSGTFTVAGSSFLGMMVAPGLMALVNALGGDRGVPIPIGPALAAMAIAYALGEGMGRLACISFGCCYGRPLARSHRLYRALFATRHFAFTGASKKASYEGGFEREPLIPIQALTAVVHVTVGLIGLALFLRGAWLASFVGVTLATQAWRALSETLRADYRGSGRLSTYQIMAGIGVLWALAAALLLPAADVGRPDVVEGLRRLWNPTIILALQVLWLGIFLYWGRSVVTAATISIHVVKERV